MGSGSDQWKGHNAAKGYTGMSKWTKKDFEANFGKSPAATRRATTPKRAPSTDPIPF